MIDFHEVCRELDSRSAGPEHALPRSVPALNPSIFVVHPRTQTILVVSSDPQERMRLVRRFLKDGFDVDAYGLWHPSLIDALDVCDAAVVDTQSYAQVLLATTEIPDTMDPPRCVVIANDNHVAERLRRALRLEIFIRPVNAAEVSAALKKLCCTPGIEGLGSAITEPIGEALMRWASEDRTIAIEGRWRHERGTIYIDGGEIFHARAGSDVGEQALDRMLYWPIDERRFWTLTALRPQRQTIYGDPELALLDASHRAREIKDRVDSLGGLDSVWTFDWKAFQEQEEELSFSVDQLLPWLEGTDYLARKIFVADAELVTTLRVVEDLIRSGVLKPQAAQAKPYPQSRRGYRQGTSPSTAHEKLSVGDIGGNEPEPMSVTLAEERLPSLEGRFQAADFSDSGFDEPLAPLLEEKEGILAETDRLRAQLAALEAEKRAHGVADSPELPTSDERSDRATRLFWRQVAFEQHARLALTQLKQRNSRLDGSGENPEYAAQLREARIVLGDDSGLFSLAREAFTFARELRDAAGTMRGEEPGESDAEDRIEPFWAASSSRAPVVVESETRTDRFGFSGAERSQTAPQPRHNLATRPVDQFIRSANERESHLGRNIRADDAEDGDRHSTTSPSVLPSGSYQATQGIRPSRLRRPVTEPRTRPSGSYEPLRPILVENERAQPEEEESASDEHARNAAEQAEFLRTEIFEEFGPLDDGQSQHFRSKDGPDVQSVRSGPPPFRSLQQSTGPTGRDAEADRDSFDEPDVSVQHDDEPQIFTDSYDEALEDALDELFEDPRYQKLSSSFDDYDGLETESVLEDSGASLRSEISDIWLAPDAVQRPSRASVFAENARKNIDTDQQPITTIRKDGKDLQFVHAFPSSENAAVASEDEPSVALESEDELASNEESAEAVAPRDSSEGKPFQRFGNRRGTGPTNTLLLSAVPAPKELLELLEERSDTSSDDLPVDDFEEENTPVAGVDRVSDVVLGKAGFHETDASDRAHVITADVDDLGYEERVYGDLADDIRDDDTVDLPSGSALLKLIDEEAAEKSSEFAAQNFDQPNDLAAESTKDLSVHEPRIYVWIIALLMLAASILILLMSDDEETSLESSQSTESSAIVAPQNRHETVSGFDIMPVDDAALPADIVELDAERLSFGISHGGEVGNGVRRSATEWINSHATPQGSPE